MLSNNVRIKINNLAGRIPLVGHSLPIPALYSNNTHNLAHIECNEEIVTKTKFKTFCSHK